MKTLILSLPLLLLLGCQSAPVYEKVPVVSPTGTTNWNYVVSPGVSNLLATAGQLNNSFVPAPFNGLVDAGLGVMLLALGAYARYKSQQANAHQQAADVLAGVVVKAGKSVEALQAAPPSSVASVARHIDNNTI